MTKAKTQALIRQYQTLFLGDLDDEAIEAMKTCIREIILPDDHPSSIPFSSAQYTKQDLGKCFFAAEKGAFKQYIAKGKIEEIKIIIETFNSFSDPKLTQIELGLLRDTMQETTETLERHDIKNPLHCTIVGLFKTEVQSHPEITGFESLYQETLSMVPVECNV